jgi:DNA-directed RNA polymerase specialized sigma24 family protein
LENKLLSMTLSSPKFFKKVGNNTIKGYDHHMEDIYQDFLLKLLIKDMDASIENKKGFLVTCWKNHCLNWIRGRKHELPLLDNDRSYIPSTTRFDLEQVLEKKGGLSKQRSRVLIMFLKGYTFAEIGKKMRLSPFTVRTHYLELIKDLKKAINQ